MSPLLSPEERLKRLKSISLDEVLGRGRRTGSPTPENRRPGRPAPDSRLSDSRRRSVGPKSAAAEERERQRREAFRRSKSPNQG